MFFNMSQNDDGEISGIKVPGKIYSRAEFAKNAEGREENGFRIHLFNSQLHENEIKSSLNAASI